MDYEIVTLQEKTVMGVTARTNNSAPDMGSVTGGLWEAFYQKGFYEKIPAGKKDRVLGIYSDYEGDETADYNVTVACEVTLESLEQGIPEGMTVKKIPAGRYAKFVVKGHVQYAVMEFWQQLWQMNLDRAFAADFEEYQDSSMEEAEIHIYIGLK